jgi:hypothetical protein
MAPVRRVAVLLLAAGLAAAEDDKEFARDVAGLVEDLGATEAQVRTLARFRLAAYGDRVRPLLERVESDDPEVRRAIRYLTRAKGKETLELLPRPDGTLAIGAALTLEVRILNNTEEMIQLLPDAARQGEISPFRVRFDGKTSVPVRFDQVDWSETAVILPGASRRFRITLPGGIAALRRPALHDVSVAFAGTVGRGFGTAEQDSALDMDRLQLESAAIQVHVLGRRAEDLEKALASESAREKEAAAKELGMRDDEEVVPILRRHAREPLLRLAAIQRLGAGGAVEDFGRILEATTDANAVVRRAAVLGLGKYPVQKARARLLSLAADQELQADAIVALQGHKHVATVDLYLKLLGSAGLGANSEKVIQQTLREWTGITVDKRPSEIAFFRGWWETNRASWAQKNAKGK